MPRIGLLSDSHGDATITRRAVELLQGHGMDLMLHLGDVGNTAVIDALLVDDPANGELLETHLVFGNTDWDATELGRYAQELGIVVDHPSGRLAIDGSELVFCHGHETGPMRQAIRDGVRYLCHGHTHQTCDSREDRTRIINPGALHRAREYTVALLDTASDALAFYSVRRA